MTKVICIVGLPGSGKTTLAYRMADDRADVTVIDDIRSQESLPAPDAYAVLIITDPWFCMESVRVSAEATLRMRYGTAVEWIFFENDPAKALANVERRADGRLVTGLIAQLSRYYRVPEGVTVMRIWSPD